MKLNKWEKWYMIGFIGSSIPLFFGNPLLAIWIMLFGIAMLLMNIVYILMNQH